jgi:hypothetical protein
LFHGLFFMKAGFRLLNGASGGKFKQHAIPPTPVNWAMRTMCSLEERVFSWLRVPYGTSVLAVLQRGATTRDDSAETTFDDEHLAVAAIE